MVALASVAFVVSVVVVDSVVAIASLYSLLCHPHFLMRSNNTDVEPVLINLYEFPSRIKLFSIHSKQHLHHNH